MKPIPEDVREVGDRLNVREVDQRWEPELVRRFGVVLTDLRSRILSNERTALSHPDPLARERAKGRAQAYRVAVEALESGR